MNSKGIVALKETGECLCIRCLKKKATHIYEIKNRRYGSIFDSTYTKFQVCDDCDSEDFQVWVDEEPVLEDYIETYEHEDDIREFIDNLPLESQELFYNRFDKMNSHYMDSQDWIDYELGELSNEKCKEYGLATPKDIIEYIEEWLSNDL